MLLLCWCFLSKTIKWELKRWKEKEREWGRRTESQCVYMQSNYWLSRTEIELSVSCKHLSRTMCTALSLLSSVFLFFYSFFRSLSHSSLSYVFVSLFLSFFLSFCLALFLSVFLSVLLFICVIPLVSLYFCLSFLLFLSLSHSLLFNSHTFE